MIKFLNIEVTEPTYKPEITAWREHGPFAMWLIRTLRPHKFVELGSHWGYSYFAVCEAVAQAGLKTKCTAVDTWQGDSHAGFYSEEVFERVVEENKKYESFSTLLRKTFDEALADVKDGSVDLLHIDGRHGYEDVLHDYETWITKLAPEAVVLFHDTTVRERDFGVFRLWEEIAPQHPSFNFFHGHGLGVLCRSESPPKNLKKLFELSMANGGPGLTEAFFAQVGGSLQERKGFRAQHSLWAAELEDTKAKLDNTDDALQTARHETQALNAEIERKNRALDEGQRLLNTARRKPFRMLRRYVLYKLLKGLSKCSPPLPIRVTARFSRSADKRNPRKPILDHLPVPPPLRENNYKTWIETVESRELLSPDEQQKLRLSLSKGPTFSVVIPVYNPDPALLKMCIQSVLDQIYDRLEVCIADDASSDPRVLQVLDDFVASDSRVKLVKRETNGHISAASNSALELATRDYIALLDHDDLLPPHALLYMAKAIVEKPEAKVLYSDEDKIDIDGAREQPHFKPDFNRDLLYSNNYISHLGIYSRELVSLVGGFREGFEGAQDYDLLLRCVANITEQEIVHIPHILYHWRLSDNSTSAVASSKNYAHDAGKRALKDHLKKTGYTDVSVADGATPFTYRVDWQAPTDLPKVTLLIPTRDRKALVEQAVDSIISKTTYPNYEIIILDNQSTDPETLAWFSEISSVEDRVRVLRYPHTFNYSAINNFGVENSDGAYICLVNNDVEVISSEWLDEMVALAVRPNVGCVGAMLYYPNDTIQHAGVFVGVNSVAAHGHRHFPRGHGGYFGRLLHRQTITAVTGACLLVSREIYNEVGRLNAEDLTVAFNDIDFCLKVAEAGYNNIWTPFAELYHHESVSRGRDDTDPEKIKRFKSEKLYMRERWSTHTYQDRHYNPNLTLDSEDFTFRWSEHPKH